MEKIDKERATLKKLEEEFKSLKESSFSKAQNRTLSDDEIITAYNAIWMSLIPPLKIKKVYETQITKLLLDKSNSIDSEEKKLTTSMQEQQREEKWNKEREDATTRLNRNVELFKNNPQSQEYLYEEYMKKYWD